MFNRKRQNTRFRPDHQAMVPGVQLMVKALERHKDVKRVQILPMKVVGTTDRKWIRADLVLTGVRVTVRGGFSIQRLVVHTANHPEVLQYIENRGWMN